MMHQIQVAFKVTLPINLLLTDPAIEKVASIIAQNEAQPDLFDLKPRLVSESAQVQITNASIDTEVAQLSDAELDASITAELAEIEKYLS
jgi:hypothetical protein